MGLIPHLPAVVQANRIASSRDCTESGLIAVLADTGPAPPEPSTMKAEVVNRRTALAAFHWKATCYVQDHWPNGTDRPLKAVLLITDLAPILDYCLTHDRLHALEIIGDFRSFPSPHLPAVTESSQAATLS